MKVKNTGKHVIKKMMPSARIELAILSLHTRVVLVIRFTTKPRGLDESQIFPTLLDWLVSLILSYKIYNGQIIRKSRFGSFVHRRRYNYATFVRLEPAD